MRADEMNSRLTSLKEILKTPAPTLDLNPAPVDYAQMKRKALNTAKVFHNTVHVYNNDEFRHHCVPDFELEGCIKYNSTMRFGRAIFVDGQCVHAGYLTAERIAEWERKIKDWPMPELHYPRS